MGCWNETCGLSGLAIPTKTPCLLFLLAPGNHLDDGRAGYSYPSGMWQPRCLPVTGVYNDDRGTLDLDKKIPTHWAYTQRMLGADHLAWSENFEDPTKGATALAATYTPAFFDFVERGRVYGRSSSYGFRWAPRWTYPLGQMLVRTDVWDHLLAVEYTEWGSTSRAANRKAAEELVDHILDILDKKGCLSPKDHWSIETHFRSQPGPRTPFHWLVFEHGGGELPAGGNIYRVHLTTDIATAPLGKQIDRARALEIFYDLADLAHVGRLMSLLRLAWRPQCGKGSQDTAWELHRDFANKVAALALDEETRDES